MQLRQMLEQLIERDVGRGFVGGGVPLALVWGGQGLAVDDTPYQLCHLVFVSL